MPADALTTLRPPFSKPRLPAPALAVAALAALGGLAALGVVALGPTAVLLPVSLIAAYVAFAHPRAFACILLGAGIAIDPLTTGATQPIATALWEFPAAIRSSLPITVSPYEVLLTMLAVSVALHPAAAGRPRLPALAYLVPAAMAAGMVYGLSRGAPGNLVYHEARGLIFGTLAFFAIWRLGGISPRALASTALAATVALGVLTVARYAFSLSGDRSGIPMEFWFAHETGLFLALGFVLGCVLLLRPEGGASRWLAMLYTLLMASALLMTGRRSAILVVLVGIAVLAWFLLPKRPLLLIVVGVPLLFAGAGYLAVYWDGHSGPLAEPARAVKSQFSPDARDQSSDEYRRNERENLQLTLDGSPVLGIGFGIPYTRFIALPTLDFWPLQFYTPHQNLLWLWLKMGIAGASVTIGFWILAFRRCLLAVRAWRRPAAMPVAPFVLGAGLLMYLTYARVDLAFVVSRSAVPLAALLAFAFLTPETPPAGEPAS